MNEFDQATNAGRLDVTTLVAALENWTVLLHGVTTFGQKLGNIQDLYVCLEHLMRRFGEGRVG